MFGKETTRRAGTLIAGFAATALLLAPLSQAFAQQTNGKFTIARLKYGGGGDWYNDPGIIPNLHGFVRANTRIETGKDEARVSLTSEDLFVHPMLFITGHGRIQFSDEEVTRLRDYLMVGGFLYADDDYGMDKFFRAQIKRVFPDKKFVELPFSHEIYHNHFDFPNGLPKTHEHDGGPPHGYAMFHEGRMIIYYTFNTNISDGWADPEVHHDTPDIRRDALRMGTNIVVYALTH